MANAMTVADAKTKELNMRKPAPGNNESDSVREEGQKKMPTWIGVDLDGTLAKSVAQTGEEIGAPVHSVVQLVKEWLAHGEDVRIFTARVNPNHHQGDAVRARRAIEAWCKRHIGQILPVTYEKDWDMVLLLDDRARQVEHDTGRVICAHPRADLKVYKYAGKARAIGGHRVSTRQSKWKDGRKSPPINK